MDIVIVYSGAKSATVIDYYWIDLAKEWYLYLYIKSEFIFAV